MIPRANAVPFWVPARFLLTGAFALAAAATALTLRPDLLTGYYAVPAALAVVHTLTLGFCAATLLGAMHQLMPVVLVTNLYSPRLGTLCFALFLPGAAGVILGFATGYRVWLLATGGSLIVCALLVFVYNIWRTNRAAGSRDAVSAAMLSAVGYLTATAVVGVLIALSRRMPGLAEAIGNPTPLHLGLGLFGTFFLAIAGAGHKLLGMFVLSHGVKQLRLRLLTAAVHLGLALVAVEALTSLPLLPYAAASLALAVALFAVDIAAVLRKRMRRRVGLPLRLFIVAPLFLAVTAVLVVAGQTPAAVAGMLLGFVTLSIAGMYGKILGFLTWQSRYGAQVGRERVPLLADLPIPLLDRLAFWCLSLAIPLLVATQFLGSSLLAAIGSAVFAVGAWSLVAQALWIVFGSHSAPDATQEPPPVRGGTHSWQSR